MKRKIDELRQQALALLRENEAQEFIISPAGHPGREAAQRTRSHILSAGKKELLAYISGVREHIRKRRQECGVKAKPQELISFLEHGEKVPNGNLMYMPAFVVRGFFRDYSRVWPDSALLPAHTRIMFDAYGLGPSGEPIRGIRLLEATVYEDMAALCNLALDRSSTAEAASARAVRKMTDALCRATVAAAVYFVEAYLNGLAFDHLAEFGPTLSSEEKGVLQDWDPGRNRPRYLSLRDKLLRYQRIATKQAHATLQPSNCREMTRILEVAEFIRNPLAHPSPHLDPDSGKPDKELAVYAINLDIACEAADCAVSLVQQLEKVIYGDTRRIPWLLMRSEDGRFPKEAFD